MKGSRTSIMIVSVACCLLALVATSSAEKKPAIVEISKEAIKSIHDDVEFFCRVQDAESASVLWKKHHILRSGDPLIISTDGIKIYKDERYSIKVTNGNNYTLSIRDLKDEDMGKFECKIQTISNDYVSQFVQLQMNRPPKILPNVTRVYTVKENEPATLSCEADGFPTPRVQWKRQDDVLLSTGKPIFDGNVLKINKVNKVDRGVYYCLATVNNIVDQLNVTLQVEFAPVVTSVRPSVGQAKNHDVSLECKVEALPAPRVTWYDASDNEIDPKHISTKTDNDLTISTLTFWGLTDSNYGIYKCEARNDHGKGTTKFQIFPFPLPCASSNCG